MSTIGNIPSQYSQPGNVNNVPAGLTSTLDPSKLKQLSPAQLDAIKNLPPEKLASLNNVPIDQLKKLDPNKLKDFTSKLPNSNESKNKLDKTQKQIKDRKDKEKKKSEELEKSLDDKKGFLKDQVGQTAKNAKLQIASIATPILMSFIRAENIADLLIKKLTKDTKQQLQNKGTLTIENGVFTFTPSNPGNYAIFKSNFDRRVSNIKRTVETLNRIITTLNNIIRVFNIALSVIKIYIKIKQRLMLARFARITAELAAPTPSKPTTGVALFNTVRSLQQLEKDNKKIDQYQAAVTSLQLFLTIFKEMLTKIRIKINRLQFNLIDQNNSGVDKDALSLQLEDSKNSVPSDENYTSASGKTYILKLTTLPNEQRQYQALDSFSKLKITQTAPSRLKTDAELLEEIKSILG
jgi:hypothetical protein